MSRLTKKDLAIYSGRINGKTLFDKVYNKLGQIEDLEDELGCPLEVVFKALTFGFVNNLKEKFSTKEYNITLWKTDFGWVLYITGLGCYPLIEYKKTWWLKEDLSE